MSDYMVSIIINISGEDKYNITILKSKNRKDVREMNYNS